MKHGPSLGRAVSGTQERQINRLKLFGGAAVADLLEFAHPVERPEPESVERWVEVDVSVISGSLLWPKAGQQVRSTHDLEASE